MKFTPVCCGGISLRIGVKEKVNAMKMDEEKMVVQRRRRVL